MGWSLMIKVGQVLSGLRWLGNGVSRLLFGWPEEEMQWLEVARKVLQWWRTLGVAGYCGESPTRVRGCQEWESNAGATYGLGDLRG